ncbi:MAG: MFS transporter [Planctomycetales bacterium]
MPDSTPANSSSEESSPPATDVAQLLLPSQQTRNVLVFAACTGLQYLAAPVLYVGMTQGSLLNNLGASPLVANLPETAFFILTATPVFLAWWLPGVKYLKRSLIACYLASAGAMAVAAAALLTDASPALRVAAIILQGAVIGASMPTAIALLWEAIGRGVEEKRRGFALGLAFGAGPLLAVAGSLGSQWLLTGELWGFQLDVGEFPLNYVWLFVAGIPVMLLAAILAGQLHVVADPTEPPRMPLLKGAIEFLANPVLRYATLVTILLYVGNTITANMNLYTEQVLDADPSSLTGYQNAIRFSFKVGAGTLLGWLLTQSTPRAGILVTGLLFVLSQVWAIFATGYPYLLAFGIFGAGELVGVYAPNYILSASQPRDFRRNMAYVTMMMAPAAPAGALFGWMAGVLGQEYGAAAGFRLSFALCAVILLAGLGLALGALPARPKPLADQPPPV